MSKLTEMKDKVLDLMESIPNIVWYVGMFVLGLIVGGW